MMLSRQHQLIFLKVAKTAGAVIEIFLRKHSDDDKMGFRTVIATQGQF